MISPVIKLSIIICFIMLIFSGPSILFGMLFVELFNAYTNNHHYAQLSFVILLLAGQLLYSWFFLTDYSDSIYNSTILKNLFRPYAVISYIISVNLGFLSLSLPSYEGKSIEVIIYALPGGIILASGIVIFSSIYVSIKNKL